MSIAPPAARQRWLTLAVFAVSLAVRLLYWQATPDRGWPHSALYKGDALVWSDYAGALAGGESFELGLPLRPPGNGYLLRWLGVGGRHDAAAAKPVWCLLGAAAVALFYRAALAAFGAGAALLAALWCSLSNALLILSTSLNNETPYLTLVAAILLLTPRLAESGPPGRALAWGALNGLACLVRVEHSLFVLLVLAWLVGRRWRRRTRSERRRMTWLAASLGAGFLAAVLPWQLTAWQAIAEFNRQAPALDRAGEAAQRGVERATARLRWTEEARAESRRLPGFARRAATNFVAATVLVRGGSEVRGEDFGILEEAFGSRPRRLPARPFVALYGPLNFYLANRAGAPPGFDPDGLDRPPPLAGGIERYPRALLGGLPPRELTFFYPPHVELVTDGYRLGGEWIRRNPVAFLRRAGARLDILWQGAALGWTGRNLPWGGGGLRRAVDLRVPRGAAYAAWRIVLLALVAAGAWLARGSVALAPWLAFAAAKLVAAALFFGYARHGATLVPVVAALAAVALVRLGAGLAPRLGARRALAAAALLAALGLAIETHRWLRPPGIAIDGREIGGGDPIPPGEHRDRRIEVR